MRDMIDSADTSALHPLGSLAKFPLEIREKIYQHVFEHVVIHYCTSKECIRACAPYLMQSVSHKKVQTRLDMFHAALTVYCAAVDMKALLARPQWHTMAGPCNGTDHIPTILSLLRTSKSIRAEAERFMRDGITITAGLPQLHSMRKHIPNLGANGLPCSNLHLLIPNLKEMTQEMGRRHPYLAPYDWIAGAIISSVQALKSSFPSLKNVTMTVAHTFPSILPTLGLGDIFWSLLPESGNTCAFAIRHMSPSFIGVPTLASIDLIQGSSVLNAEQMWTAAACIAYCETANRICNGGTSPNDTDTLEEDPRYSDGLWAKFEEYEFDSMAMDFFKRLECCFRILQAQQSSSGM